MGIIYMECYDIAIKTIEDAEWQKEKEERV
mgnify:FL=1